MSVIELFWAIHTNVLASTDQLAPAYNKVLNFHFYISPERSAQTNLLEIYLLQNTIIPSFVNFIVDD